MAKAWASCATEWCEWGSTDMMLLAPTVDSKDYAHAFARSNTRIMYHLTSKEPPK